MKSKKLAICCAVLIWAVVIVSLGCGKGSSYSLLSDSDTFKQTDGTFNNKIDILWVIDNSGSMQTSQQDVIDNLNSFSQDFVGRGLDFKMAVTTTDAYKDFFVNGQTKCSRFRDGILNVSCNTVTGKTYSGVRVMDQLTSNLLSVFAINTLQTDTVKGIFGSGDERAFQSMKQALNNPLNAGFLRENSFLSIIIVSDEDDFSHNTSTMVESINATYASNPWSYPNLHTIQSYTDYLDALTGSTPTSRRYHVNAMAIFDEACRVSLNNTFTGRKIGIRYGELIDSVNSAFSIEELKGRKGSLCGNFADDLNQIASSTQSLASQFTLQRLPIPSTIVVTVNGNVIPNRDDNPLNDGGWIYEPTSNSIFFIGGNYLPQAGSSISVKYDPVAYGQ